MFVYYNVLKTLIECDASANPPVLESQYTLIVDGNVFAGSSLVIEIQSKTVITCEATNIIGKGSATITTSTGVYTG